MIALKERSEKDIAQHESEMKDLQRVIHHDNKLKEFFNAKSNDRALYKEEEEAKKSKSKKYWYSKCCVLTLYLITKLLSLNYKN